MGDAKQKRWTVSQPRPAATPAYTIVDENGRYVAHVEIHTHNCAADDAHLIAAAPELLEALRGAMELVNAIHACPFARVDLGRDHRWLSVCAAIAKTNGSAS